MKDQPKTAHQVRQERDGRVVVMGCSAAPPATPVENKQYGRGGSSHRPPATRAASCEERFGAGELGGARAVGLLCQIGLTLLGWKPGRAASFRKGGRRARSAKCIGIDWCGVSRGSASSGSASSGESSGAAAAVAEQEEERESWQLRHATKEESNP